MGRSVLIVDDEPQLRQMLRLLIEQDGRCSVCGEAGNGRQALELIESHDPDLLLLDLRMPVMDGLEVLAALEGHRPPHVVVLTASTDLQPEALEHGADGFVVKGGSLDKLLDTLVSVASS